MSDTKPLPAAQLLALADAMDTAFTAWEDRYQHHGIDEPGHDPDGPDLWEQFTIAREAYRAARSASPVTLEEALLKEWHDRNREQSRGLTFAGPAQVAFHFRCTMGMLNHARTLAETDNARRLAGEGGGQ